MSAQDSLVRRVLEATDVVALRAALDENEDRFSYEEMLVCASAEGIEFIVRCMLGLDVDIYTRSYDEPPLYLATLNGHDGVVKALLEYGYVNFWRLGERRVINLYLLPCPHRADPNAIGMSRICYRPLPDGVYFDDNVLGPDTVAGRAIRGGRVHILEMLLRHDVDVYALTSRNKTFLDAALAYEDADVGKAMVVLLLERGIDFDIQDKSMPPLDDREHGRETVNMRHIRSDIGEMVEMNRRRQSLCYLRTLSDEEIHTPTLFGQTSLHRAAENGHLAQVRYLVECRRANPFIRDVWGRRPYESAEHRWDFYSEINGNSIEDGVEFYTDEVRKIMWNKRDDLQNCANAIRESVKKLVVEYNMYKMMVHARRRKTDIGVGSGAILSLPPDVFEHIRGFGVGWVPESEQCWD